MQNPKSITVAMPGHFPLVLSLVMLDFTGTLARDGILLPGAAARLRRLSGQVKVVVATADTMGRAEQALKGLPVDIRFIKTGAEKARLLERFGASRAAAIGNGRNDVEIIRKVALGIAVIGPEGACGKLVAAADVVVHDVRDAFDLLLKPLRLIATLRK